MSGIQIILLTGVLFIGLYLLIRWEKKSLHVVLLFAMVCLAVVFIIWPEYTQLIADKIGVGRGADLVFYLSILIFWFVVLKLYARMRRLEQMVTEMVRQDALNKALDQNHASKNSTT